NQGDSTLRSVRLGTPTPPGARLPTPFPIALPSPSATAVPTPEPLPSPTPVIDGILVEFPATARVYVEASVDGKQILAETLATGCLVERYPTELAAELPVIDAFVGARNWSALPSVVSQLEEARAPGSSLQLVELAPAGELDLEIASRHVRGASAYLKISDGCD